MLFVTHILFILLLPLSILAGMGKIASGVPSPLRRAFTVAQSIAVFGVILYFLEVAYASVNFYAAYFTQNVDYLRGAETAMVSLYWLVAVAAEVVCRKRDKIKPGWVWSIGVVAILCANGLFALLLYLWHYEDVGFTLPAVIACTLVCLLHWTNLLLPFDAKWQRGCITAVNALNTGATLLVAVWALRVGAETLATFEIDPGAVMLVAAAGLLLLAPCVICAGTVAAAYLRGDGDDEDAETAFKE